MFKNILLVMVVLLAVKLVWLVVEMTWLSSSGIDHKEKVGGNHFITESNSHPMKRLSRPKYPTNRSRSQAVLKTSRSKRYIMHPTRPWSP